MSASPSVPVRSTKPFHVLESVAVAIASETPRAALPWQAISLKPGRPSLYLVMRLQ